MAEKILEIRIVTNAQSESGAYLLARTNASQKAHLLAREVDIQPGQPLLVTHIEEHEKFSLYWGIPIPKDRIVANHSGHYDGYAIHDQFFYNGQWYRTHHCGIPLEAEVSTYCDLTSFRHTGESQFARRVTEWKTFSLIAEGTETEYVKNARWHTIVYWMTHERGIGGWIETKKFDWLLGDHWQNFVSAHKAVPLRYRQMPQYVPADARYFIQQNGVYTNQYRRFDPILPRLVELTAEVPFEGLVAESIATVAQEHAEELMALVSYPAIPEVNWKALEIFESRASRWSLKSHLGVIPHRTLFHGEKHRENPRKWFILSIKMARGCSYQEARLVANLLNPEFSRIDGPLFKSPEDAAKCLTDRPEIRKRERVSYDSMGIKGPIYEIVGWKNFEVIPYHNDMWRIAPKGK